MTQRQARYLADLVTWFVIFWRADWEGPIRARTAWEIARLLARNRYEDP